VEFELSNGFAEAGFRAPMPESEDAEIWHAPRPRSTDYARKCSFLVTGCMGSRFVPVADVQQHQEMRWRPMPSLCLEHLPCGQFSLELAENLGIQTYILPIGD